MAQNNPNKKSIFLKDSPEMRALSMFLPQANTKSLLVQPSSFQVKSDRSAQLLREYNRCLVERHGHMSRREIKKKDTVDLRPILDVNKDEGWSAPQPQLNDADEAYTISDYYYAFIPCFEEGVYHVNSGRYIHWKLKDLDLERHIMVIFLQDYIYYEESGWQPGVYGDVEWAFHDPEDFTDPDSYEDVRTTFGIKILTGAARSYVDIYQEVDLRNELHWSDDNIKDWEALVMTYARQVASEMTAKGSEDNLTSLAAMFTHYTIKTNRILTEHKKAKASRPVSKAEHEAYLAEKKKEKASPDGPGSEKPKERRIRTIGAIEITSKDRPKPGRRAMANYKKKSWTTRAHMRTLASGKKTYVRKSTHHRKALADQPGEESAMTPVTLRIIDADPAKNLKP